MMKQRILRTLAVMAVLLCVAAVPALALTSKVLVADVSPDGGSTNVGVDTNISATFNIRMARRTINNKTFYLKQEGSSTVVPAQVTYAGTTKTATLDPTNELASGATYTAYIKGGRTGVRGTGGQKLAGTTDTTATFTDAKVSWTFTAATPPDTTIDSSPPGLVNSSSATFTFSSSKSGSTFECSLDGGSYEPCEPPEEYTNLSEGSHILKVRAIDATGNIDPTPASHTWTVDTVAPAAPSVHPDADIITNDSTPTISGTAEAGSTVKIYDAQNNVVASGAVGNDNAWSLTLSPLQEGAYSYTVKATDTASNESQGSSINLTIDTTAPETTITSGPPDPSNIASASFAFSSNETGSTFQCSLDGAAFGSCTSPKAYAGLTQGSHIFQVKATDVAGNTDVTPPSHSWRVDTIAPTVTNVSPVDGARGSALSANVTATFSEAMDSSSITDQTFTLTQQGSSTPIEAIVSYNSTARVATLNPGSDLAVNTTYTATLTTGVKDLAGNSLAQQRSWTFTTGDGTSSVTMTPNPLTFSVSVLCPPQSKLLEVKNNGSGSVTFAEVSITGPDAARFSSGAKSFLSANGPFTLLGGNNFFDEVTFVAAGGPPQPRTYEATLTYKDGTGATIGTPVRLTASSSCIVVG